MKYAVRANPSHYAGRHRWVGSLSDGRVCGLCCSGEPHLFNTLEEAVAVSRRNTGYERQVVEVSWVLRWTAFGMLEDWYASSSNAQDKLTPSAKQAYRFSSYEEAKASLDKDPHLRPGYDGPFDSVGYKIVRRIRVVK